MEINQECVVSRVMRINTESHENIDTYPYQPNHKANVPKN